MKLTINQTLKPSDYEVLGNTLMSVNKLLDDSAKYWRFKSTKIPVQLRSYGIETLQVRVK